MAESKGELILYTTEDGRAEIQMRTDGTTVWMTQAEMAQLFDTSTQNIQQRIAAIFTEGELPESTINSELIVRQEGTRLVRREVMTYNLDMVLAVGYRVRSPRGTQFRQWATTTLREYLIKGFVMNDDRLKDPGGFDYFDELLERIRDIRASEKRFYQKLRDLFATSIDYDSKSDVAPKTFATIQNKLIYAVSGCTAAELVVKRADPSHPTMGLTSWAGGRVRKADITVAKNYLTEDEIDTLNRLTTQFLDFAEGRAKRRQQTTMTEWVVQTDRFIDFNEHDVLPNAGRVSAKDMKSIACERFQEFDTQRRQQEAIEADQEDEEAAQLLSEMPDDKALDELKTFEEGARRITPRSNPDVS
ncbi:virulence RhuM family protein [Streptosporangium subroseum]|uniref:virulence RhuM family protein n=1 Tax=Streptosporangium subroseum TaxID=106412 RepID=UPI0030883E6D|nr:virulence RhuM family protein [Streptosporangium subroseum]